MDTLKTLLGKAGVSNELAAAICEEFARLSDSIKQQHDAAFKERLEKAKKVCLEELAKEKSSIARKVKVYLESKARSFEESAERTRKIEESESATKIRRVIDLLTDGNANADGDVNGKLAEAQKLNSRLEKALTGLKEQRDQAVTKAKRALGVAEKAITRNQTFESMLSKSGLTEADLTEEMSSWLKDKIATKGKGGKEEGKKPEAKPAVKGEKSEEKSESVDTPEQKLDESRKVAAKSKAPAPVLESNQKAGGRKPITESATTHSDSRIAEIAQAIPELE